MNRAPGGAEILVGGLSDGRFEERLRLTGAAYCRANDLAFSDAALFVTLDRASCGLSLRDLAPGARTGRVLRIDPDGAATVALDDLAFPNGVAPWNGGLAIAETRADRLRADEDALELPGGPDNLTALADGRLLVALHPALLRLALRRAGLPLPAPSRIVAVAPGGGVEALFDDPEGASFSGASVAVLADGKLIAGSAFDDGLLICGGAR